MELYEAKKLALSLMTEHGLMGWRFEFNNRKQAYGLCSYRRRKIELSKHLTAVVDEDAVRNTILHEIAHALVGSGHGHDYVWQRKALEIGCDGNRTNNHTHSEVITAKYMATCSRCGKVITAHRKPKRGHWCRCNSRPLKEEYRLKYIQQY